jgi:hypothetical protein
MNLMIRMLTRTRTAFTAALAALLAGTTLTARAQDPAPAATGSSGGFATTGGDPFAQGEKVLFVGLSVGGGGVYGDVSLPPLNVGMDFAISQYLTVGGLFGFSRYGYYSNDITYLTFVGRMTFHPTFWLTRVKVPIDPYGIATAGYTIGNYSGPNTYRSSYSYLVIGPGVGIRYWFSPHWAGQAETSVGAGVGLAGLAIAYKF